ncbi:MAG: vWA domain-containing protein [Syntrophomonadaceae bacterium]
MQFFNLAGLGFALIIPIIILLYLLKPRREEMVISSTFLWEQVLKDIEASNPWQRLKKNLLLFLQLLAAALLVVAIARPYLPVVENSARHLVVVLDCSASMAATDVSPSRFAEARRQAGKIAAELGPDDRMTLITMAEKPEVLVSASHDGAALQQVLEGIDLSSGSANLEQTLSIVTAMLKNDKNISLLILTDGGVLPFAEEIKLSCPIKVELIGNSEDNVGITTLATRQQNKQIITLARVQNFSSKDIASEIELRAGDVLLDVKKIELKPGEIQDIIWEELPVAVDIIEARLLRKDAYPQDNQAWAVAQIPEPNRALLVTESNIFLEKALALCSALELYKTKPSHYLSSNEDYSFYIFDGWLPPELPHTPIMVLNPPPGNATIKVNGSLKDISSINIQQEESLLRYVDVNGWQIAAARSLSITGNFKSLLDYENQSLLGVGEDSGQRMAVFGFDLHESNIPLQAGFPILINNLVNWLLPERQDYSTVINGNEYRFTPLPETTELILEHPDGSQERFLPPFPSTYTIKKPGPYRFTQVFNNRHLTVPVVKNYSNLIESAISPQSIAGIEAQKQQERNWTNRELWPYLVIIILGVLLLEWEVYRRGY